MSHFVLILEDDPAVRHQFRSEARRRLQSWPGLTVGDAEVGRLAVAWAHGPSAPQSHYRDGTRLGLVLGNPLSDAGERMDARGLCDRWAGPAGSATPFDGYFAAVAFGVDHGLTVGGDVLGLFPVYYHTIPGGLIAGSSAHLFGAHPRFEEALDLGGLVGVLLGNALLGGRSLVTGVRRLGVGCQLRWRPGQVPREGEAFRLTPGEPAAPRPMEDWCDTVEAELRGAIRRHRAPGTPGVLMLSGGLDSRLMAGCLRAEGIPAAALTLGRNTDFEVAVASRVAGALGMLQHRERAEPGPDAVCDAGRRIARWEHLAGGFSGLEACDNGLLAGSLAPGFWSGYGVDELVGGETVWLTRDPVGGGWPWRRSLARMNRWGMAVPDLVRLLPPGQGPALVEEQVERYRAEFEREDERPEQRAFRMKLATRVRFHIGALIHRMSFGSWPLLPIFDRRLMNFLFRVPPEVLMNRRLEKALLARRFPALAAIPREHNSFRMESVRTGAAERWGVRWKPWESLGKSVRRWYWQQWRGVEPRRYYRSFDLNNPSWRAIRQEAWASQERLDPRLDRTELRRWLPPPTEELRLRDPFVEGAARRTLLGLLLWSAQR
jgi:asparagine synthase (glutamine-hydrolysing)